MAPEHPTTNGGREGFTLLEVVIALGILTVGIGSALALFTAATAAHKRAVDRVHVASIAEQAFADIESALNLGAKPEDLLEAPPFESIKENWPGYQVSLKFLVLDTPAIEDELLVLLEVSWVGVASGLRDRPRGRIWEFQQIVFLDEVLD